MESFERGDIVLVDLGIVANANVKPCVIVSVPNADSRREMCVIVPLTREILGSECEVALPRMDWLKSYSVINVLGIVGIDTVKILRRLGKLPQRNLEDVYETLLRTFGLIRDSESQENV